MALVGFVFFLLIGGDLVSSIWAQMVPPYTEEQVQAFAAAQFPESKWTYKNYDFIIIGAGSAGCVLANRLSEIHHWNILLIEAGPHESLTMDVPGLAPTLMRGPYDWNYTTVSNPNYGSALKDSQMNCPRGKAVGGSSSINFMIYTRGQAANYDQWASQGCINWNFKNVARYFRKLENYQADLNDNWFGHYGPVEINAPVFNSEFAKAYYNASVEWGLQPTNINGEDPVGIDFIDSTTKGWFRMSANRAYLMPIRKRKNLHLKINSMVTKILFEGRRAVGVEFYNEGTPHRVYAKKEVLLSAGAFNSPKILMLSGVGEAKELHAHGIMPVKFLPVGNNLMDHAYPAGFMYQLNQSILTPDSFAQYRYNKTGVLTTPGGVESISYPPIYVDNQLALEYLNFDGSVFDNPIVKFNVWNLSPEFFNEMYALYENKIAGVIVVPTLLRPKSRGTVRLQNTHPESPPLIDFNFLDHPDDLDLLLRGVKDNLEIYNQESLVKFGCKLFNKPVPQCKQFDYGGDDYWRCQIRSMIGNIFHPCGTNKMGLPFDKTSVVDCDLNVIGLEGLRVVDSSIMPDIPGGHLNIPTMMIGEKAADIIKLYHC